MLYASGSGPEDVALDVVHRLDDVTRPTLVVIDDVDIAGADVRAQLATSALSLARLPVLVLVCFEDTDMLGGLHFDGVLTLGALSEEAVGAIGRYYASTKTPEEIPADWLLQASSGLPRRVHELASQWARREAARRVGVVAGRAESERAQLRAIQDDLVGGVVELQEARERILARHVEEPTVVCPFKGLASYGVSDADYFFGRERLVAELVARLVGTPLLAVVGPSGSGKSSVMHAGLLPELAAGVLPGSEGWEQVLIRPGAHPVRELAAGLANVDGDRRIVLAVDQFEETFTVCGDETERSEFVAELVHAAQDPGGRYVVVIALRADYYGRCAAYPELSALIAANDVLVRSMQRDELQRAVGALASAPGCASKQSSCRRSSPTSSTSREACRCCRPRCSSCGSTAMDVACATPPTSAPAACMALSPGSPRTHGQLNEAQQAIARGVLMRLVSAGDGDAVERRRVALDELEINRNEDVARIVALLTDRRLLTVSVGTVEVAHEALLREWPRLREWTEEDRAGLRIQRALSGAAKEWERLGRDDGRGVSPPTLAIAVAAGKVCSGGRWGTSWVRDRRNAAMSLARRLSPLRRLDGGGSGLTIALRTHSCRRRVPLAG